MISLDIVADGRTIAIYGTGLLAAKCAYDLEKQGIEIGFLLNSKCKIKEFCNHKVYDPEDRNLKDVFVLVAVSEQYYKEIAEYLSAKGLVEFKDYIYHKWINKKLVLLHGNCHMQVIQQYLLSSDAFQDEYIIYPNPLICCNENGRIEEAVLANCDVWIHEDIQKDNQFGYYLSDEYMRAYISETTKEIVIPHLFGLGRAFFPQNCWNPNNMPLQNGEEKNGLFPRGDSVLEQGVKEKKSVQEIIEYASSDYALEKEYIISNFRLYMNKIQEREKDWDIKIFEFIVSHYKKEKLFYDSGHPTNVIMKKISSEIIAGLGIKGGEIYAEKTMDFYEEPVYPIVKKVLGLEWEDKYIRTQANAGKLVENMDLEEYIREYLWYCHGMSDVRMS